MLSPTGFVENGYGMSTADLTGLPDRVQARLHFLAEGRAEPVGMVVHQICEWLLESEDEHAEGSVAEALIFYMDQHF